LKNPLKVEGQELNQIFEAAIVARVVPFNNLTGCKLSFLRFTFCHLTKLFDLWCPQNFLQWIFNSKALKFVKLDKTLSAKWTRVFSFFLDYSLGLSYKGFIRVLFFWHVPPSVFWFFRLIKKWRIRCCYRKKFLGRFFSM